MEEEKHSPEPVLPMQVADPTGNHATSATIPTARPKRKWIIVAGIFVLVVIILVALLVSGVMDFSPDPVIGTWNVPSADFQVQFDADGTATLRSPAAGSSAAGRWQKVAENQYQLVSAGGTKSPLLVYDPIGDTLHTADYSLIFVRKG